MTLETLEVYYEDRRCLEYLDLLYRLLVLLALGAEPSVLRTQLLVTHELLEAVINLNSFRGIIDDHFTFLGKNC